MKKSVILILLLTTLSANAAPEATPAAPGNCTTTKEFVTTLEFLRSNKAFQLPELEAQKLATQVSAGCTGSAGRFIRVASLLLQAEMTSVDAIGVALQFSGLTDAHADAFVTVFKSAFLADNLDLDFRTSTALALSLSANYAGDIAFAKDDFTQFVKQCLNEKYLDLPRPECGSFAARISRLGDRWEKGVSKPFFEIFEFLRSEKGPNLITGQALTVAEEIIKAGPGAPENFTQAYRYAISKSGLKLPVQDALRFAKKMAEPQKKNDKKNVGDGVPVMGSGVSVVPATGA